jgi:hypothetical protein
MLIGGAIGYSFMGVLLGLFVELGMTRKFEGRIFLYVAFAVMLLPSLGKLARLVARAFDQLPR